MWSVLVQEETMVAFSAASTIFSKPSLLRPGAVSSEEMDLRESESDMIILPPPELYADLADA